MQIDPLGQFTVKTIASFKIGGYEFGLTNSSLVMMIAVAIGFLTFWMVIRNPTAIPNRIQAFGEMVRNFVLDTLHQNHIGEGDRYFPFIFSLFLFLVILNLLGIIPYSFSVTGQIAVTFALAFIIFILLNIIAFAKHGLKFLDFFLPKGIPLILTPVLVLIELFVYFIRPITLAIRLTANMIAGHVFLYIATAFIAISGIFLGILPVPVIIIYTGFEVFVAVLQAYIFTILTCVYLSDALYLH